MTNRSGVALAICLAAVLAGCGQTLCDELGEEAEAAGCAVGLSPAEAERASGQDCDDETELARQAQCYLDLTENVCDLTPDENTAVSQCLGL